MRFVAEQGFKVIEARSVQAIAILRRSSARVVLCKLSTARLHPLGAASPATRLELERTLSCSYAVEHDVPGPQRVIAPQQLASMNSLCVLRG